MKSPKLSAILALCCAFSVLQAAPSAKFPQVECANLNRFTKAQRDHIIYAYNFGAPKGMGYTMAAIAWQESCAGAYMMNFSDPSAGLYHAHIPVVLKYYSSYSDTPFTRNVMGQLLIDDRRFASQVALDSLMYWHKYHKGNHKNIIKSYNKGFKWEKDRASNKLAESYYLSIGKKIRALESYIPKYSRVKNQSTLIELHDKNKSAATINARIQNAKPPKQAPHSSPKPLQKAPNQNPKPKQAHPKPQTSPKSPSPKAPLQDDFVDLPLEGSPNPSSKAPNNYDANFEDFTLIFEGH
ncbi:hypothetical protein [Helicobacter zhangjianzhongii]|uniref:Uncharacterized protein n=1 Tax=Helicobacter zhangjianzhongii TaxID=2974574 RepID=A0ACC6FPV0_9HELI|nr:MULTISPECIES: hypothetical protein [unclassified Helicobacter]MDL0079190.1 hypothetical protein [Helicobacter sp. CPD2-1]MDL0081217.1 hypothetical protein [Helicobacter sp. XJK30-2]